MTEISFIAIFSRLCVALQQDNEFYNKIDELLGMGSYELFAEHSHLDLVISAIARGFNNVDAVEEELNIFLYECDSDLNKYNANIANCENNWTPIKNLHEFYNYLKEL